jgi:hypothetical protein
VATALQIPKQQLYPRGATKKLEINEMALIQLNLISISFSEKARKFSFSQKIIMTNCNHILGVLGESRETT